LFVVIIYCTMTSQVGPITSPNTTSCLKNMQNYFRYNYTSNFHFHQTTIFGVYAKNYQIWRKFDVVMTKVILLVFETRRFLLRWSRQFGGSSDSSDNEEEVPTSWGSFPQRLTLSSRHLLAWTITMSPTQRLLCPTIGSKESNAIGHQELNWQEKINVHILVKVICTSCSEHFTTEHWDVTYYSHCSHNKIGPTCDVIVQ